MIAAVNIALQYGGRPLFKNASFHIGPRDRIGLVGSNGAGKSTLLKILAGQVAADKGEVTRAKYVTVGYLPQEGMTVAGRSLHREVESAFGSVLELQDRLGEVHRRMERTSHEDPEFQELLEVYGELQHKLEASDAFRMRAAIEKVLMGLGFCARDFERMTEEFSGGWQMRIHLARLLLMEPSLLLLDEPTNHLDLDSLEWLEDYIRGYEGSVIIVSHDRRFLDNMTGKTYELSLGELTEYSGNFSYYVQAREERMEQQRAAFRNQQQQIKQTERFIERFRYKATKARQVQSRIKALEKLERIELEENEGEITFAFPPAPPSGRAAVELRGVDKSYGPMEVFRNLDFDIDRGDRIALVGVNGAGKSTLARILAGVEPFERGERKLGHGVVVSYFAQHQAEELDPRLDVLQTVDAVATGESRKGLRSLLGCFLFSGDDVFKQVGVLSGGEKSRLALAKMLLQPSNLIVLDEPTNHLDMRSKAVLQDALNDFEGSCVIVSHDRDFLDPLVTKVVEVRGGRIRTFLGNVGDYVEKKRQEEEESLRSARMAEATGQTAVVPDRERKRIEAELRQKRYAKTKPIQDEITAAEQTIGRMEAEKASIESVMGSADFYRDGVNAKEIAARYRALQGELTEQYYRWDKLQRELERLLHLYAVPEAKK
jgi:ATP-binding cassette subfamily F protein 3